MGLYEYLCLFGFPALFGSILGYVIRRIKKNADETKKETLALRLGVQALLRDRLYQLYKYCVDKHFATIDERDNFMNLYSQYHSLGANGVMDNIVEKFNRLPTEEGD